MRDRNFPEINAGSMADIAFLLLIFFLVTTTLSADLGIVKLLPEKNVKEKIELLANNVLEIDLNSENEILIDGEQIVQLEKLRQLVVEFIDNGAGTDINGEECTWCDGKKDITSSDHPNKAVIKLQANRNTSYASYISVQNEIIGAYSELRNRLSFAMYDRSFETMELALKKDKNNQMLQSEIKLIREKYPHHILEEVPHK